jgi:hypothetical protein
MRTPAAISRTKLIGGPPQTILAILAHAPAPLIQRGATAMTHFAVGQKWTSADGNLHGELIEISDERNVLEITDDKGTTVRFTVTTAESGVVDRNKELSHLATELQRRYVGYMQQKEYLAYLGFVVYLTAASTILLSENVKWPPANWGSYKSLQLSSAYGLLHFSICASSCVVVDGPRCGWRVVNRCA